MFIGDERVLYVYLHRYDDGSFCPGTKHPATDGVGSRTGYNVNIGWNLLCTGNYSNSDDWDVVFRELQNALPNEEVKDIKSLKRRIDFEKSAIRKYKSIQNKF